MSNPQRQTQNHRPSGRVLRLPHREAAKRMRRKLVKFTGLLAEGKMRYSDVRASYQSWRGNYKRRFDAYHRIRYMDRLYNRLFISEHRKQSSGGKK